MNKKVYRYYGGLLKAQENWLNRLASKGYKLIAVNRLSYEFETCSPHEVQYCIDFVGEKAMSDTIHYKEFLEGLGYCVYYKNMNLNYSIGKLRIRPWAEKGGGVATNKTTYNKELLIVERNYDDKPFQLHTTCDDKIKYYQNLIKPWLCLCLLIVVFGSINRSLFYVLIAMIFTVPIFIYQIQIMKLYKEANIME